MQLFGNSLANKQENCTIVNACKDFAHRCLQKSIFVGFVMPFARPDVDPELVSSLVDALKVEGLWVYLPTKENDLIAKGDHYRGKGDIHLRVFF